MRAKAAIARGNSLTPLLAVCGSLKPAPGRNDVSACRELLGRAVQPVARLYPAIATFDLREADLPPFDGREAHAYEGSSVTAACKAVQSAGGYAFSIPTYWGSIGAGFKNFVEVVCGPGYTAQHTPFKGKPAAVLLVGSEPRGAIAAVPHILAVLDSLGIYTVCEPVVVVDPRNPEIVSKAVQQFIGAIAGVAREIAARPVIAGDSK